MLGGPDRRTLFILTAEWRKADGHTVNLHRLANVPRTGEILTVPVSVPGAGRHDRDRDRVMEPYSPAARGATMPVW